MISNSYDSTCQVFRPGAIRGPVATCTMVALCLKHVLILRCDVQDSLDCSDKM